LSPDQAASLVYLLLTLFGLLGLLIWMWQQWWRARVLEEIREVDFCLTDFVLDHPELRNTPQVAALREALRILQLRPELCGISVTLGLRLLGGPPAALTDAERLLMELRGRCPAMEIRFTMRGIGILRLT
jgi:hypothetical protein